MFCTPRRTSFQFPELKNGMQATRCTREFVKQSKERGRRGLGVQILWELSPIKKTGSGRNVTETAKDGNERKEAPKPTRIPP